ncbi:hypothetical protein V7654_08120 [Bacillus sp. JJ1609]|uniref:hypothetical protein n=1 Tax=Bacillus sp. JJ1609 TaxID=3122977 RepID=UPI002FFF3BFB
MRKILLAITFLFLLAVCTNEKADSNRSEDNKFVEEIEGLQDLLDERPNLNSDQRRETLNLSFKTIAAMERKDYQYLESISDSGVSIDKETDSFHFEGRHDQNFLQTIDYSKLEYRFHNKVNNKSTVGFAENNAEIIFEFIETDDTLLLHSFITN